MDKTQVAQIAERLTEGQVVGLTHLAEIGKPWKFPVRWSVLVGYSLEALGLARRTFWQDKTYITRLGSAVRSYLESQTK